MTRDRTPRYAVITGAGTGIGRATAAKLNAGGHHVVLVGRNEASLADTRSALSRPELASVAVCDVTDEAAVVALFDSLDRVDVLVSNAGVAMSAPFARTTVADVNRAFQVNAVGTFLCLRAALPRMKEASWGRAVVISSISGVVGAPYIAAYTASKHAAIGLVRSAAVEFAGQGVTVNAVCPTYVRTPMTERTIDNIGQTTGRDISDATSVLTAAGPLGRLLEPEEVAHAVEFLCSALAGGISGQALVLDGGGIQH